MIRFLWIICLLIPFAGSTQFMKSPLHYKSAVSFSPLALVQGTNIAEGDNTFMLGYEYRLKEKIAVVSEVGIVFSSNYAANYHNKVSGYILRPSFRMYLNRRNNLYVQTQVFFKSVNYTYHDSLPVNVNGDISRAPLNDYTFKKDVWGLNFMLGAVLPVWKENIFLEPYIGIGRRTKYQRWTNLKNADYNPISNDWIDHSEHVNTISIPAGIKIVFRIR